MIQLPTEAEPVRVVEGDCLDTIRAIPSASISAVICDPPYPCIDREYGRWTEAEWFALMDQLVEECRRVLKPTGSAVFVLQPNSERVGRMRTWLWEFMAKWGREWGMVQDAYWWNITALPVAGSNTAGTLRPSLKSCVWLGPASCYRDQGSVLAEESPHNARNRRLTTTDTGREARNSVGSINEFRSRQAAVNRGGVTPFNVLPIGTDGRWSGGTHGHGASTPMRLLRWWVRYICPPGGTVLDPFLGSGTTALAALAEGRLCIGSERFPKYAEIARRRVSDALGSGLLAGVT